MYAFMSPTTAVKVEEVAESQVPFHTYTPTIHIYTLDVPVIITNMQKKPMYTCTYKCA